MQEMQKYVPKLYNDDKSVKDIVEPIPFGGDQLTVERATNCKVAMSDGNTKFEQLNGLTPKFEDWHLKKTLYEVNLAQRCV